MGDGVEQQRSRAERGSGGPARWRAPAPLSIASQRADRQWRRPLVFGFLAAAAIHIAVLLMFRTIAIPESPFSAAGPAVGDVRAAAGGGSGLEMVEVRPASEREEAVTPTETPVPVPEPVEVDPQTPQVDVDDTAPAATPSLPGTGAPGEGGDAGTATGPGRAEGAGQGGGGTEGAGDSGLVAPTPRAMFLPPADRPRSVRGREITVWVFVNPDGRVAPDSTRLEPPTPDRGYNNRLRQSAAQWRFNPATRAGRPVGAWYPYEIIL